MKTLKNIKPENNTKTRVSKLFQAVMILAMLFIASDIFVELQDIQVIKRAIATNFMRFIIGYLYSNHYLISHLSLRPYPSHVAH